MWVDNEAVIFGLNSDVCQILYIPQWELSEHGKS